MWVGGQRCCADASIVSYEFLIGWDLPQLEWCNWFWFSPHLWTPSYLSGCCSFTGCWRLGCGKKLMNIDRFCIYFRFFWLQIIETSKTLMNIDRYCIYFSFFVLGTLCIKYVSLRSFCYFSSLAMSARSCMMCFPLWTSQSCFCHMSCCTSWISASHMIHTILFAARVHLEVLLISVLTSQTK